MRPSQHGGPQPANSMSALAVSVPSPRAAMEGHGVVQLASSTPTDTKGPALPAAGKASAVAAAEVQDTLAHVTRLVSKVGESWGPWKMAKNKQRTSQAVANLESLKGTLMHNVETIKRLEHDCSELEAYKTKCASQAEQIAKLKGQVSELQQSKAHKAAEVSDMLTKVESVAGAPKRYLKLEPSKEAELLQQRVDLLVRDYEKLKGENDKLHHSKMELTKRIKEMQDKARDDAEVREREARRVNAELKKESDAREAAVATARSEGLEQLAVKNREMKALQKRMESLKQELETVRGRESTGKREAEQASGAATKLQQDVKAALKKAADARAEKEQLTQQLALARDEMAMVAAEYTQVIKMCKELGGKTLPGCAAIKADGAPWPRQAFTVRGSCVLHSRACGKVDSTRLEPREYTSVKQLEGWLAEGLVLCKECRSTGF